MSQRRIENLDRLQRTLARMPQRVRNAAGRAAFEVADSMVAQMKFIAPRDDTPDGDEKLVDHIYMEEGEIGDVCYVVISDARDSEGRPKAPRVELGHMAADGTQVPAEPYFYPVVRTNRVRGRRRIASAISRELRKPS